MIILLWYHCDKSNSWGLWGESVTLVFFFFHSFVLIWIHEFNRYITLVIKDQIQYFPFALNGTVRLE